jgi:arginine/ornithine N-succinyltransferase beta subunit
MVMLVPQLLAAQMRIVCICVVKAAVCTSVSWPDYHIVQTVQHSSSVEH